MNRRDLVCGIFGTTATLCAFPVAAASPKKHEKSALPSLKSAIERGRASIVAVWPESQAIQTGVMVATSGIFITVGDFASRPLNVLFHDGSQQVASQLYVDPQTELSAHRLTDVPGHFETLALAPSRRTGWVVGLFAGDAGIAGALGQCAARQCAPPSARFDLPCPKGSAVVNTQGALVGVVQRQRGASQCDVLLGTALSSFLQDVAKAS